MKEFNVVTTEILSRTDVIEAETEGEALLKAKKMWKDEINVLTGNDFCDVQFEIEGMEYSYEQRKTK